MKIKFIFTIIFLIFASINKSNSDDIDFEASTMDIKDNGNLILAYNSKTLVPSKKLEIKSNEVKYYKKKNIIIFIGEVYFYDQINNMIIESNKINYDRNSSIIYSSGDTFINYKDQYKIKTNDVFYNRKNLEIYGEHEANIEDSNKNYYNLKDKFKFRLSKNIIQSEKSIIIDNNQNKYIFENLILDLNTNEIAGKELKVEYEKSYFGNKNNDPELKGRSVYSNDDELKVYKAVFSTCNTDNKKCRGWELSSKEFRHDKKKKVFEYKDSWLKIFDYKVFFLPYFNHPDPSVKRKSGFLTPSYSNSEVNGNSIKIPYFKVLGIDRDLTFNPIYFADKSFLLQNEYRQIFKNSYTLSDFGFLVGEGGTKGHFFYNQIGKLSDQRNYEINIESVRGDDYLKNYNLKASSKLITNDDVLKSRIDLNQEFSDAELNTSFKVYEDLSRNKNDRYQYILPEYDFVKNIEIPDNYNGSFIFSTSGYNKNYNTNLHEAVLSNTFHFNSNDFVSTKGVVTHYDLLLENTNSYSNNSSNFQKNANYTLFETVKLDLSLPLIKKMDNYNNYLKPKASFRYSPNGNTDMSLQDNVIDYNNAFSLNRIGSNEGGEALTLGLEFEIFDNEIGEVFNARVGNILKPHKDVKMPSKSKLDQTRSDIFGDLNYKIGKNLKLGYSFSYDRDLDFSNLDSLDLDVSINNLFTNFNYYTENNDFGDEETLRNKTKYKIDNNRNLIFTTAKDLKDDFTEYYNLAFEYLTDCISINLNYNKTFYSDGNLEPDNTLSFLIKIIPFTEFGVPNIGNVINRSSNVIN